MDKVFKFSTTSLEFKRKMNQLKRKTSMKKIQLIPEQLKLFILVLLKRETSEISIKML